VPLVCRALIVSYILKTTAGWGDGKIGQLDIDFTVRGRGSWQSMGRWEEPSTAHRRGKLHWSPHDFAPRDDFGLAYDPPRNGRAE